jgi:hypothetical protein
LDKEEVGPKMVEDKETENPLPINEQLEEEKQFRKQVNEEILKGMPNEDELKEKKKESQSQNIFAKLKFPFHRISIL